MEFYKENRIGSYGKVLDLICKSIKISIERGRFVYFIVPQFLFDTTRGHQLENLTIDYSKVLYNGLQQMKYEEEACSNDFCRDYNWILQSMINLAGRIADSTEDKKQKEWFVRIAESPAIHLDEAMQRILYVNQLFWQTGHLLMGLGNLDNILFPFYEKDCQSGIIDREKTQILIKDFIQTLHRFYWLKSNGLMGDTGQIIILGRTDKDWKYICNELTYMFIDAVEELQLPDPKLLLRVNRRMPQNLMERALQCMKTGVGSPLLSNDEIIIPLLSTYGIEKHDAFEYGTSACWEPLISGKSISQNNVSCLNYLEPLQNLFEQEKFNTLTSFDKLLQAYFKQLSDTLNSIKVQISDIRYQISV